MHRYGKYKGNIVSVHCMKACRGSRGIAPLTLNLDIRWRSVVSIMPRPFNAREINPVPIQKEVVWGLSGDGRFGMYVTVQYLSVYSKSMNCRM